jgi:hypothetical protein
VLKSRVDADDPSASWAHDVHHDFLAFDLLPAILENLLEFIARCADRDPSCD